MIKKILLLIFIISISQCFSQSDFTFKKIIQLPYGGSATAVKQLPDESYIVCGYYLDSSGYTEGGFLAKLSKNGLTQWYKKFEFPIYISFNDLTFDFSGDIYICANSPINITSTDINIVIIKTDSIGNVLWTKGYGGPDVDFGITIDHTSDDNIIISGYTESYELGSAGATSYTIKVDLNGNQLWNKYYGDNTFNRTNFVKEIYPNKYVSLGINCSSGDCGSFSVFDGSGTVLCSKNFVYSDFTGFSSVTAYKNGGYLVAGYTASFSGPSNLHPFLMALDQNYNFLWAKKYTPPTVTVAEFISVNQTSDGNYIVSFEPENVNGTSKSVGMIKLDSAGVIIWGKLYQQDSYCYPYKLISTIDGGYMEVGFIQKASLQKPFIIKTDNAGDINGCVIDTTISINYSSVLPSIANRSGEFSACIVYSMSLNNNSVVMLDSILCVDSIPSHVGIEDHFTQEEVIVYPNPLLTETVFSFSDEQKNAVLLVYDFKGAIVSKKYFSGIELIFRRNDLASGVYFYRIISRDKLVSKGKLIFK